MKIKFLVLAITILLSFSFVKGQDSYTPLKMNNTLKTFTKSKLLLQSEVQEFISSNKCTILTKGRSYAAPVGLTAKKDIKNGAKGIDEWVQMDKGNAFVLNTYKWVLSDNYGSKQLYLDFDTLICDESMKLNSTN